MEIYLELDDLGVLPILGNLHMENNDIHKNESSNHWTMLPWTWTF